MMMPKQTPQARAMMHPIHLFQGRHQSHHRQSGVVLAISLIMLVIISLLTVFSMREATSTEAVANNTRVTGLATQAAEIALRYCETAVVQIANGTSALTSVPTIQTYSASPRGQDKTNWDTTRTGVFTLPLTTVNQTGLSTTYKRAPECVVEKLPLVDSSNVTQNDIAYLITARGFGPEVSALTGTPSSYRPDGSEVWLQSTIKVN
jgi:Tfp pilus assembly protein PilX